MEIAFWIWIGVFVLSVIIEAITLELVSAWFAAAAVIPLILSATKAVSWQIQLLIFVVLSILFVLLLRKATLKALNKNSDEKTNKDILIGMKVRMIEGTDFETLGRVKINDVEWSAIGDNQEKIEKDELVKIVGIEGNKLKVKKIEQ